MKYLFVFSPGRIQNDKFKRSEIIRGKRCYLGGDIRLNAVLSHEKNYQHIVLVGGDESKLNDMETFLTYHEVEPNKIIRLISKPNTLGNIEAIHTFLTQPCEIGFLSNFYHFSRILTFYYAKKTNIHPTIIIAEGPSEIINRCQMELNGVVDFHKRVYQSRE